MERGRGWTKGRKKPGIRMQIDVIAHDATARGLHTKLHRGWNGWDQINEKV